MADKSNLTRPSQSKDTPSGIWASPGGTLRGDKTPFTGPGTTKEAGENDQDDEGVAALKQEVKQLRAALKASGTEGKSASSATSPMEEMAQLFKMVIKDAKRSSVTEDAEYYTSTFKYTVAWEYKTQTCHSLSVF